ncbi:MAG: sugar phosphate nucleotidyltransferase [Clostridiales bacterium]|nr:sugar phosphate nucleotidyltransferase [Clostridiales bacterium]
MKRLNYLTIILSGDQSEKPGLLTKETPEPIVTFGGAYRLIDFTLSNCLHSHTGVIGVLTQNCHPDFAEYIHSCASYAPTDKKAEIVVLPPKTINDRYEYYRGSADAIEKNMDFIEQHNPDALLVLSGDQIYKMDYAKLLAEHKKHAPAVTIAALQVPWTEAPRFGIMETETGGRITDYEEKPFQPKSNLASMGIYVFNWKKLKQYIQQNNKNHGSGKDLGKDIIPLMLMMGETLTAYLFDGYWKDISNIYNLWEAQMELLSASPRFRLQDESWNTIHKDKTTMKHYDSRLSENAQIINSYLAEDCKVRGTVRQSVVSAGVEIMDVAKVVNSVIMPGAKIGRGAFVHRAIIGANAFVKDSMIVDGANPNGVGSSYSHGVALYTSPLSDKQMQQAIS